jgi:hypothetical protein
MANPTGHITQVNGAVEREILRLLHDSILPHPERCSTAHCRA